MSRKRAQGTANSPELASTPVPAKRIRNNDTHFPDVETTETTTRLGLDLMRLLKKSTDKTGRNISGHFVELPDKNEYPGYYLQIAMPVSLNMVEQRLNKGEYQTLTDVEQDLKRLVQNAKDFNSSKSEVYEDAERIRKAMSNFMPKHNPAYRDKEYRAVPTPIPQALADKIEDLRRSSVSTAGASSAPEKIKLTFKTSLTSRQSTGVSTEPEDGPDDQIKSAHLALLDQLSTQDDAINFEERPSRKDYPDYYKVIRNPTAINDVRSKVQKDKINGWQQFANEIRLIWDNAKEYNEPGSDIYAMAENLDAWIEPKIQAAGAPPRTKLTLSQPKPPPSVKLKFGSSISGPSTQGITIDNDSLRRQKEDLARANRAGSRPINARETNGTTPVPSATPATRRSESTKAPDPPQPAVNGNIPFPITTPALEQLKIATAVMPPTAPHLPTPVLEGVPPTTITVGPSVNGVHSQQSYQQPQRNLLSESDNPLERKYRDTGKTLRDALISSVTFMTHPSLPKDPHWKLTRYASTTKTQQSFYTYLPHSHNIVRVIPQLSAELKTRRNHKLCVTVNWNTVSPSQGSSGQSYDFRLSQGENVISVDVIAELKEGEKKEYAPPQLQVDFERMMLFVYLRDAAGD